MNDNKGRNIRWEGADKQRLPFRVPHTGRFPGFLYVDKTEYVWKVIRPASEMYFLSRPRRFGKSRLISTLKAIFQGKKELFKGLALYDKPYDWNPHPVIHLDMTNCDVRTPDRLVFPMSRSLCVAHFPDTLFPAASSSGRYRFLYLNIPKKSASPCFWRYFWYNYSRKK